MSSIQSSNSSSSNSSGGDQDITKTYLMYREKLLAFFQSKFNMKHELSDGIFSMVEILLQKFTFDQLDIILNTPAQNEKLLLNTIKIILASRNIPGKHSTIEYVGIEACISLTSDSLQEILNVKHLIKNEKNYKNTVIPKINLCHLHKFSEDKLWIRIRMDQHTPIGPVVDEVSRKFSEYYCHHVDFRNCYYEFYFKANENPEILEYFISNDNIEKVIFYSNLKFINDHVEYQNAYPLIYSFYVCYYLQIDELKFIKLEGMRFFILQILTAELMNLPKQNVPLHNLSLERPTAQLNKSSRNDEIFEVTTARCWNTIGQPFSANFNSIMEQSVSLDMDETIANEIDNVELKKLIEISRKKMFAFNRNCKDCTNKVVLAAAEKEEASIDKQPSTST